VARPDVRGEELAPVLEHGGPECRALAEREPLPHTLENRLVLAEETLQRFMQVLQPRCASAGSPHIVPHFVCEPLHVVGKIPRQFHDRGAESRRRFDPRGAKPGFDELREPIGRDAIEPHHGTGLVERTAATEHPLHERRLGTGKHVADIPLMLRGGAQRVFDAASVEGGDGLEFVEGDGHLPAARIRDAARQREDFGGQERDVLLRARSGEGDGQGEPAAGLWRGLHPDFGTNR